MLRVASILTSDDLDGIGMDAVRARDPKPFRAELLDAVENGRLADPADTSYALSLAADIAERCNDEADALALSTRAVAAAEGTIDHDATRGRYADLLLRFGHTDEGLRELRALRPLLTRDRFAPDHVVEPLVEHGHAELAEEWLTTALETATDIADRAEPGSEKAEDAWEIVDGLALWRRSVRRGQGRPPDEMDDVADVIAAERADTPDLLFWPQAAFDELISALPGYAESIGATWDEHRADIERELQAGDAEGDPVLVEVATPELLAATTAGDDTEAVVPGPVLAWPPGRNEPCWCGSRTKYKKCCLPRARPAARA